jgi:serine/threonine protein kinase
MSQSDPEEIRLDPALAALAPGSRVAGGRFTLVRVLGQGGMGVVWLARDEHLRENVALKFLPPEIRHDAVALDDLRRETSRNRKLTHLHIIRIHDLYKVEQAFISMEYVDGPNLSELRLEKTNRVLKWTFLEPLVKQLCDALEYAHRENIIHRDLKPANMMLDARGRLKLADFGIAAVVSDSVSRVSMGRHGLSGTASYMSPQQLDGQMPQVTDDVYSFGSTLYELLTSRAPFFTGDIAHQVRTMPPQSIEKRLEQLRIANQVPLAVSATIMACLAKDPSRRPQSVQDLAEHMGLQSSAMPVINSGTERPPVTESISEIEAAPLPDSDTPVEKLRNVVPGQPRSDPARTPGRRPRRARKRSVPLVSIVAVIALIVGAGGGWWWWSQSRVKSAQKQQTATAAVSQFISLFNGHDFTGWVGDPQVWSVTDGAITATGGTSEEHRPKALFWRDGTVQDFELHVSFRLHSGNSGIYYRAKQLLEYQVSGYQFEVNGNETGNFLQSGADRRRRDPGRRGSVTINGLVDGKEKVIVQRSIDPDDPDGKITFRYDEWYDAVIIVQGNRVIQKLNGRTLYDATDNGESRPRNGTIALETYGGTPTVVQYRDIRLKRLPPTDSTAAKQP